MKYIDIHVHMPLLDNNDIIPIVDISSPDLPMSISTPYCTYGIHPWFLTEENADSQLHQLEFLLQNNAIIAIGEVGFDTTRGAGVDIQYRIFNKIILLSEYYKKPLIIHCVKAWDKLLSLHKNRKVKQKWIIHGFHGSSEQMLQLINRNIMLSFGAKLLNNRILQSIFPEIPMDSLFLETDDADVSIVNIYRTAAEIRKIDEKILKRAVFKNFMRIFSCIPN